jgi:hypothetical protein
VARRPQGREIYSEVGMSKREAILLLQNWARRELAKAKLDEVKLWTARGVA